MSETVSSFFTSIFALLGLALTALAYSRLRRPGGTITLAAWFVTPGLLVLQGAEAAASRGFNSQLGAQADAREPLFVAVALCAVGALAVLALARRIRARGPRRVAVGALGLLGAGGVAAQAALGALPLVVMLPVMIGLAALYTAPSQARADEEMPLLHAAGALWSIMIVALAAIAALTHMRELEGVLREPPAWPTVAWLDDAGADLTRTLMISSLTGLAGLAALAASVWPASVALRRDRVGQACGAVLCVAGLLGLWAQREPSRPSVVHELRAVTGRLPSKPAWVGELPLPFESVPSLAEAPCVVTAQGAGWQLSPARAGLKDCRWGERRDYQPYYRLGDIQAAGCQSGPGALVGQICKEIHPALMVGADRLASEVAPALARSAEGVRAMLLEPPLLEPRRGELHLHVWPQIDLGWVRGADLVIDADDYGARQPDEDGWGHKTSPVLVERGGRALLLCGGAMTELGADLKRWSNIIEGAGCKHYSYAPRVYIVLSPAWTVQDVVDRCVSLMPHVAGCDVLDAPPAGLAEVLAKLEKGGR